MKRCMLLLPLAVASCGDQTGAKLDQCKNDIRAELTALLDRTRRDAAESLKALEPATPADGLPARQAMEAVDKFSNDMIKAMPDMFAAMAVPNARPRKPRTELSHRFRTRFEPIVMRLTMTGVRES